MPKKTKFICDNQDYFGSIKSLNNENIKVKQEFTYLESNAALTKKDVDISFGKPCTALNKPEIIWKSSLSNNLKKNFCQATVKSVVVQRASSQKLTKSLEKTIYDTYIRMLRVSLNSWEQHPIKKSYTVTFHQSVQQEKKDD